MELYNLSPAAGSTKEAFRKGRGHGSGNGKTGGRGHKGQKAAAAAVSASVSKAATPVNSYTTAVTMCDILKNDMKVPETSDKPVVLNGYRKGAAPTDAGATTTGQMFADAGTALNYYAVDGYKYENIPFFMESMVGVSREQETRKQMLHMEEFPEMSDIYTMMIKEEFCRKQISQAVERL